MTIKLFEVRDRGTLVVVMAIQLGTSLADQATPAGERKEALLAHAGFGRDDEAQREYVLMLPLPGGSGQYTCDPFKWRETGTRTYFVAHKYISEHFDDLEDGQVVCVEHILGERAEPKASEVRPL